jgi:hypothetical protein
MRAGCNTLRRPPLEHIGPVGSIRYIYIGEYIGERSLPAGPLLRGRGATVHADCRALRRLYESISERAQLSELRCRELGVSIGQIRHRPSEPFGLVVEFRADHTTLHDLLEHLVTSFLKCCRLCDIVIPTISLLGHVSPFV